MVTLTKKEAVYNLLKSRRWTNTHDLYNVAGTEAPRRVRELRAAGLEIKIRRSANNDNTYDYRLVAGKWSGG